MKLYSLFLIAVGLVLGGCAKQDVNIATNVQSKAVSAKKYKRIAYKTGDTWEFLITANNGSAEKFVGTVLDDKMQNEDTYRMEFFYDKGIHQTIKGEGNVDKFTFDLLTLDANMKDRGIAYHITEEYKYDYLDNSPFPMYVGQEWNILKTKTSLIENGIKQYKKNTSENLRYKVVGIETINIKLGQFECLKIEKYKNNKLVGVDWKSEKTKYTLVKGINYIKNRRTELKSYKINELL